LALVVLSAVSSFAAGKRLLNLDSSGVVIQGYDPVAFFTEHKPIQWREVFVCVCGGQGFVRQGAGEV
jgi:hypothetical protein